MSERKRQMDDESSEAIAIAKDLKEQTDKLGDSPLTPRAVREAEVIEILARDLKDKMKLTRRRKLGDRFDALQTDLLHERYARHSGSLRCWGFSARRPPLPPPSRAHLSGQSSSHQQGPFPESGDSGPIDVEKQMRRLNDDRHKTIVSDTNKLVKLTQELDAEIAANSSDTLTPEELRKLATIEKLAHSVKAKMVLSFGVWSAVSRADFPLALSGEVHRKVRNDCYNQGWF